MPTHRNRYVACLVSRRGRSPQTGHSARILAYDTVRERVTQSRDRTRPSFRRHDLPDGMSTPTHYLDFDDLIACGCSEEHPSWTFQSGRVTCPECRRVLQASRGRSWIDDVAVALRERPMNYSCDACGSSTDHDVRKGQVPLGWRFQWLGRDLIVLCDACGFLCPRDCASTVLLDMLRARGIDVDEPDR